MRRIPSVSLVLLGLCPADERDANSKVAERGFTNPVVLSVGEKSSIQALERAQGSLKHPNGRAISQSHDNKRHGTSTLFAALNVGTGEIIGRPTSADAGSSSATS
jgi:hypothetical protein